MADHHDQPGPGAPGPYPPVRYPEGCLDASGLAADLRLHWETARARARAQDDLRALETSGAAAACAIHAGSTHERLLTRIGEVALPEHIWQWCLRGRPSSAMAIVAEAPALRPYIESRTRHMLARLREELGTETAPANRDFLTAHAAGLERELEVLASFAG